MTSRPRVAISVALFIVASACGGGEATIPSTAPPTSATTSSSSIPTTDPSTTTSTRQPGTTMPPSAVNPWSEIFGEVSAPAGWTVAPCPGDDPFLCIAHEDLTSRVRLETASVDEVGFDGLLSAAGVPVGTTDLGAASAYPGIMRALRAFADRTRTDYAEQMEIGFPDWKPVSEPATVTPMGALNGYRFASRLEDDSGAVIARSLWHVAFDGQRIWLVTAEFDPSASGAESFTDLDTLAEIDPHLTLMMRDLAVGPALPGVHTTTIALPSAGDFSDRWREVVAIPYGPETTKLGTSPGGEGGSLDLGPEFGAQASDETWWIVDSAKKRLAHFAADGTFLDAVTFRPEHLIRGELVPWRLPHVLDDGSVVLTQLGPDDTRFLVSREQAMTVESVAESISPKIDDGEAIYGLAKGGATKRIDASTGTVETVDWFRTRAGTRFSLWVSSNAVTIWLPDAPAPNILRLDLVYEADDSDTIYVSVEAAGGTDGSLYLYLLGGTDSGAGGQLAGFLGIGPDGTIGPIEATRGPNVTNDPGSPAHLGTGPVTNRPWLMFVEEDGLRVFERS